MKKSISHMNGKEQNDINHIVKEITSTMPYVQLVLIGSRYHHNIKRSIFLPPRKTREQITTSYDILVMAKYPIELEDCKEIMKEWEQKNKLKEYGLINFVFYLEDEALDQATKGSFFFSLVRNKGTILNFTPEFKEKYYSIPTPTMKDIDLNKKKFHQFACDDLAFANDYAYYEKCKEKTDKHTLILYYLQQAFLLSCRAMIYTEMGLYFEENDIVKNIRLVENISTEVSRLFPYDEANSEEDKTCLYLLQKGASVNLNGNVRSK